MWSCFRIPKEREEERHFLENGARVLKELITSFDGRSNPIPSFSKQELERATNNYHHYGILHLDLTYKLYKGTYEDHAILIKKSTLPAIEKYIREYINEVVVASQMSNHKNVLKLLGCCLETQIPTLVYEFPASGCLYHNIYEKEHSRPKKNQILSWESRLKIATEIADAVAYLHNGTSKPIIHRDLYSDNILLDQNYVAKLSGFGLSISIPLGQTHVTEYVSEGRLTFIAPESRNHQRFTEKSDVYSFGGVLFEILTGKRVHTILKEVYGERVFGQFEIGFWPANSRYLLAEDNEEDIRMYLKANIVEGNTEQLMACGEVAIRCVKMNAEERPSMMEAAKELRRIRRFQHDSL